MIGGQLGLERGTIASVERAGVRTADAVCAVSGYTRGVLLQHYGADPENVHVVYNAMTPNGSPPRSPSASDPSTPPTALFLGRLTRQKGVGFLLRAAQHLAETHPTARLLIAGDGEERSRLIESVAELGLAGRVFFLGSISDEAKREAYRKADVFVLPSVSEPFGLTPLEALMEGTPVVLTSTSGVAEVLRSQPAVEPWDAREMARAIASIFDSRGQAGGQAAALVQSGQEELRKLSWERSAEYLESALEAAVARAKGPPAKGLALGGTR
jgi:glycosyltransferase involved in cell wall biosynthesis